MRVRLGVLVLALLALLPSTPARAVGAFGGNVRVAQGAYYARLGIGTDGVTRGFVQVGQSWRYVQGSGSRWTTSPVTLDGNPLAVAVSGTTTWFVVRSTGGLYVRSRSASGAIAKGPKLTADPNTTDVTLAAADGRWWAVWSQQSGQGGSYLYEAHTLAGDGRTRLAFSSGSQVTDGGPSLAWMPATRTAVIVWTHGRSEGTNSLVRTTSKGGAWGRPSQVDSQGFGGVVVTNGSTVAIAAVHRTTKGAVLGVWVGGATGALPRRQTTLLIGAGNISIGASGSRITATFNAFQPSGATIARVLERNGSTWTEATLAQPAGSKALDTQSYRGRARVFFYRGSDITVRSQ